MAWARWEKRTAEFFAIMFLSPLAVILFIFLLPRGDFGFSILSVLAYLYYPGFIATEPLIDRIPYRGWVVSLIHGSLAAIVQNLLIWGVVLLILRRRRGREI